MIPALRRVPQLRRLVDEKAYFVLHAPRQTGKTTALLTLAQELTSEGRYVAAYLTMETGDAFPGEIGAAEDAILSDWRSKADARLPARLRPPPWPEAPAGRRIGAALSAWAEAAPLPLVIFLDEIDSLRSEVLRSVLRQLRSGFADRPRHFPWSIMLCGVRDVRDYKIASGGSPQLRTASPFNIQDESLTVRNFTAAEVGERYGQHTQACGQIFTNGQRIYVFGL